MSYQVIARKWRPQTFDDIVGQEHVTTTLKNAIASGRIGHAYLFTGIRGVGKTTVARVLAKALNCENGPTPEPCNRCAACTEITNGSSLDVKEVDGASNRGIDSVRDLREGVAFAPARDRFKVYIVDEVHMLTTEAFNALLKTLEEPPAHVVFIFATTELHKVPATIASRCQVFELKRIPLTLLVDRLKAISASEGVDVTDDALRLVAREADGSLRDACSLLDQVISFAPGRIDVPDVTDILRTGNRAVVQRVVDAVLRGEPADALRAFQEAADRGTPARQFLRDVARFVSECMKVALLGADAARETGLTGTETDEMSALASQRPPEYLAALLGLLVNAADKAADSRSPELLAQAALVRAARLPVIASVDGMVARLEAIAAGEATSATPARPEPGPRVPARPAVEETRADQPRAASGPGPGSAAASVAALTRAASATPAPASPAKADRTRVAASRPVTESDVVERMRQHPVVDKVLATFGGEVLKARGDT